MKKYYAFLLPFVCLISFQTKAQNSSELQLSMVEFPKTIKQNSIAKIIVSISNAGKEVNKDMIVNYAIDEIKIGEQKVHLNIANLKSQVVEISNPFNISNTEHHLKVWLSDELNSDLSKSNNVLKTDFLVSRVTVPQLPLIEEFTSSTCGPCASFNITFDPFLASINANENNGQTAVVKYQMNWPPPGDDPSFNADGNGRKSSYSVNSIPKSYLNGVLTSTFNQSVIDAASGQTAFALTTYFYLSGDTVKATSNATSYTTMSGSLRLHLALTEDFYSYTGGTTSQNTFHFVARKMLPNYVGTVINNIHEDTTYTTNRSYKVTYGNVTQNSFNIWSTSAGFTLVSWIQNTSTKEIYQAAFANAPSALTIAENTTQNSLELFPNPANESFTIKLLLNKSSEVSYTLTDITGKIIQQPIVQELPAGKHLLQSSTATLLPGIYICKVVANDQIFTERIVIAK